MHASGKVVLLAIAAGVLGVVASLAVTGPGPLLRTRLGQRVVETMIAPKVPPGMDVAGPGERIESMELPDLDGNISEIPRNYRGKPLLINLWASWCGPCIREMPELQRFSVEQAANGLQVVGIALDDPASVRAFLARVPVDYPILLDTPGPADASVRFGDVSGVLPYSILVSAQGRLLKRQVGPFEPGGIARWAAPAGDRVSQAGSSQQE